MKKNIAIILLGSLVLSMTGCSSEALSNSSQEFGIESEKTTDVEETTSEITGEGETTPAETTDAGEKVSEKTTDAVGETASVTEEEKTVEKALGKTEDKSSTHKRGKKSSKKSAASQLPDDILDYTFAVNGDVITVPCWYEEMEAMGWEYDGDESTMVASDDLETSYFVKDHVILETVMYNPSINSAKAKNCEVVKLTFYPEYASENDQANAVVELPGGIKVFESTKKDIINAYGEPDSIVEGTYSEWLTYTEEDCMREVQLWINEETGILDSVEFHNNVAFDMGDEEVSTERPESIDLYEEPEKISKDPFDYTCEFGGDLYAFPCPVTAFLDNGWEVSEDHVGDIVGGGTTSYVMLSRDDSEIFVYLRNYEDVALPVEYGYAQCIETDDFRTSQTMTISGNITIGSKESAINNTFKKYDCSIEKSENEIGTCYQIEETDKCNGYEIYVNNGKVTSIELQRYTYTDPYKE